MSNLIDESNPVFFWSQKSKTNNGLGEECLSNWYPCEFIDPITKIKYFNTESTEYFKDEEETIPYKYNELITFHTGRRSFISILLNEKGFSTADILSMTDHKQISTIEKYLNYNEQSKKRLRNLFD